MHSKLTSPTYSVVMYANIQNVLTIINMTLQSYAVQTHFNFNRGQTGWSSRSEQPHGEAKHRVFFCKLLFFLFPKHSSGVNLIYVSKDKISVFENLPKTAEIIPRKIAILEISATHKKNLYCTQIYWKFWGIFFFIFPKNSNLDLKRVFLKSVQQQHRLGTTYSEDKWNKTGREAFSLQQGPGARHWFTLNLWRGGN